MRFESHLIASVLLVGIIAPFCGATSTDAAAIAVATPGPVVFDAVNALVDGAFVLTCPQGPPSLCGSGCCPSGTVCWENQGCCPLGVECALAPGADICAGAAAEANGAVDKALCPASAPSCSSKQGFGTGCFSVSDTTPTLAARDATVTTSPALSTTVQVHNPESTFDVIYSETAPFGDMPTSMCTDHVFNADPPFTATFECVGGHPAYPGPGPELPPSWTISGSIVTAQPTITVTSILGIRTSTSIVYVPTPTDNPGASSTDNPQASGAISIATGFITSVVTSESAKAEPTAPISVVTSTKDVVTVTDTLMATSTSLVTTEVTRSYAMPLPTLPSSALHHSTASTELVSDSATFSSAQYTWGPELPVPSSTTNWGFITNPSSTGAAHATGVQGVQAVHLVALGMVAANLL